MPKHKLLMAPYAIRRSGLSDLRDLLVELQQLSDSGDQRPAVYTTYMAVASEIERRDAKLLKTPPSLISRGAVYVMPAAALRQKLADLLRQEQTEVVRNTVVLLSEEIGRRSTLAKRTYWRRKAAAQAFMDGAKLQEASA